MSEKLTEARTLGEEIVACDKRRRELAMRDRRNDLIRAALRWGASYREIARLLKRNLSTVYSYVGAVEREQVGPLGAPLSAFDREVLAVNE